MIERTFDAGFFNAIVNHPEVRPWVAAGDGEIDLTPVIDNPLNYALRAEGGGFILIGHGRGVYSVHTQFAPEGRRSTIPAMHAGFDFMFTRTDCMKITSQIPDNNEPAKALGVAARFQPWFRSENTPLGPSQMVSLDIDSWIAGCEALEADGHVFHAILDEAMAKSPTDYPDHPPDPAHDRYAGGVSRMVRRGQSAKGVALYNLWASVAGYEPITLLCDSPVCIHVGQGIIMGLDTAGNMEVLKCP